MMERGAILTRKGVALITKVLAGRCRLDISRCRVGRGYHETLDPSIEGLAEPVAEATSSRPRIKDNRVDFFIEFRSDMNRDLGGPLYLSEFDVMVIDPDEGEISMLVGSLGDRPETVDAHDSSFFTVRRYPISIVVTDDVEVTISYAPLCFMTYEDVEEYFANKEFVPICTIPIGPKEYFSTWTLYESEGGIKAPLDSWGYKNATLMEVESCVKVDLNARQIVAHAASDYGDRTWTPSPYSDDVYIIESDDTEKILILVRS